jgi:hypothetical protein
MHRRITVRRGSYDLDCTDEPIGMRNCKYCGFTEVTVRDNLGLNQRG